MEDSSLCLSNKYINIFYIVLSEQSHSWASHVDAEAQICVPSFADFLGTLSESWTRKEAAGTQIGTPEMPGLEHQAATPAPGNLSTPVSRS